MKPAQFLAGTITAGFALFLVSCGSGDEKTKETTQDSLTKMNDTSNAKTPEAPTPTMPAGVVVIKQRVANFAKWKMGYDSHDSARHANGLSNYVIARGLGKDSNTVVVALKAQDMTKAKEFASSTDLKNVMQKSGVVGAPTVRYEESIFNDDSKIDQTSRLMVTHKVKNYATWKKVFDDDKQARVDAGLVDRVVAHASGDANDITLVFAVNDMAKAKAFIGSKTLKDKMAAGGVDGAPTFLFYNIVQMY